MRTIDNTQDVMDSRDIIERLEELRGERDDFVIGDTEGNETPAPEQWAEENPDDAEELAALESLAADLEGYGDWEHGESVIRETYFEEYAQELAEDCGMVTAGASWPNNCIDWTEAARQLRIDYAEAEFDGVTYLMRA